MGPLACRIEEFVALITLWGFHCKIFFGSFTCQLLYVMYSCDVCSPCNTRSLFLSKSYKTLVQFGVLLGEKYNWKINLFGVMPLWMTNIVQCWMHDILFFYFGFRYLQSRGSLICSYALNPLTDLAKKRPSLC